MRHHEEHIYYMQCSSNFDAWKHVAGQDKELTFDGMSVLNLGLVAVPALTKCIL